MSSNITNFNLHIEQTSKADTFKASVKDDKKVVLAENTFSYRIDPLILSQLEDSVGKNIPKNAELIKNFGSGLFNTVFDGQVLGVYNSALRKAGLLRVKLYFKKDNPGLLRIPWEFLFDGTNFLSAYAGITLSRVIEGIPSKQREKITGKIKILAVISSPLDLKDNERLQVEREQMLILQAVDRAVSANRVEIEFEDEASLKNIQTRLDEEEYHILHYTGHGAYSKQEKKGYLLLEDDTGRSRFVDNETVAGLLTGYPSLRLVFLSGCQTAKTSGRKSFEDLSTPLLSGGIPAVISMQYSIADISAMELAEKFYTGIGNGLPIDKAITNARKELYLNNISNAVDFATPVLYTDEPGCLETEEKEPQDAEQGFGKDKKIELKNNIVLGLEQLGGQFIGRRRELRRIKEDFLSKGIRAVVLHGLGGIGKTVTSTKTAEKLKKDFYGQYTFDCRNGLKLEEILIQLNEFLKRNGVNELDAIVTSQEPLEVKINYLAQILVQKKLLLIFDNVESLLEEKNGKHEFMDLELKKGLKQLINQCVSGTRFIFTSRYTFNLTDGRITGEIDEINLGEFSEPEALMIMNRFPEIAQEDFAVKREIFEKTGGHPYTINMFGRHARSKSVKDVLKDIANVNRDMVEFTLLDKSYKALSKKAQALLDSISVFRKSVPLEALKRMMKDNGKIHEVDKEIDELIHWGLIVKIEQKPEDGYLVHTLVKDFVRNRIGAVDRKKLLIKGAEFYEELVQRTKNIWDHLDAHELYFEAEKYNKAGDIVATVSEYLHRWGFIDLVRGLNEQTVETSSGVIKAAALHHLGVIHQDQGGYEKALENYTESLKIEEELGDKRGIAATLHQIGMIHQERGDNEKAMENYTESLKIEEELGDKHSIALNLRQIGTIYEIE
ncbi:CHAT domain-containing protein, partial [candidate division KSB1 bacterium]|nr:CHAT domain-containing protein [candidate division KSB1 bacterium]